jgi:large repetitive protein
LPTCAANGTVTANGATIDATGTGTTTQFSGLSPNGEYTFMVFAFNGQGCSASPPVTAHTPPSVITAITASGPSANGEYFDFVLTGGSMGADPITSEFTVIYRLSGGSVQGSEYGPISLGEFLTADGSQYAQSISIEARACRSYGAAPVCQEAWSAPVSLGMPVDPHVPGLVFTQDDPDGPWAMTRSSLRAQPHREARSSRREATSRATSTQDRHKRPS